MESEVSRNERAEKLMGRRLSKESEERGVVPFDFPCELGYWCPKHRIEMDETLYWSEYAGFLWCEKCNRDWPSALCVRIDVEPDPKRDWYSAGPDAAVRVFLDTVEEAVARQTAALQALREPRDATGGAG